jgi:uncharacterized membrane protein YedE/YeeE
MAEVNIINSLSGGGMIGLASVLMLVLLGRIAGISGILGGLVIGGGRSGDRLWRAAFLLGLVAGAVIFRIVSGPLPVQMQAHGLQLIGAGLLVGFGTRLGSGCTSGHGVCGMARLSVRSLAATATFIVAAMITVYLTRHIL